MIVFVATNFVANLEKTQSNSDFRRIIEYLCHSPIFYAILYVPNMNREAIVQLWNSAQTTEEKTIKAIVYGQKITIIDDLMNEPLHFLMKDTYVVNPNEAQIKKMFKRIGYMVALTS